MHVSIRFSFRFFRHRWGGRIASAQEYSTRRTQLSAVRSLFGYVCSYFENEVEIGHTKLDQLDLDSPRRELSVHGRGFIVAFLPFSGINFCMGLGGSNPAVLILVHLMKIASIRAI